MEYEAFEKRKRLPPVPVFAVTGDEPFFKRRAVDKLVALLTRGGREGLGVRDVDWEGPEEERPSSIGALLSDLMTPSLFGGKTVIVVRRASRLLSREGGADRLLDYLAGPRGAGVLVLEVESLDARTRIGRKIRDEGTVIQCKRLFDKPPPWKPKAPVHDNALARWIVKEGRAEGVVFTLPVAQDLAERVGNDLGALHEEIRKLALYLDAGPSSTKPVSAEVLSATVGEYNEYGVFRLTDAMGKRDLPQGLRILQGLFEQGIRSYGKGGTVTGERRVATVLLERIHVKIRELFRARALLEAGRGEEEVGRALGKHRVFVPLLVAEARRTDLKDMHGFLEALFEADRRLKTGAPGRPVLEALLSRWARGAIHERERGREGKQARGNGK